ncbi:hypothetical protein IOD16_06775 [Saccharothrix sp. 6-C]|uniref:hypothetical protein n=1 Tax=Saccharothrix sp. 6-C TaxID=2781735 RepID=UPI0019172151|nr:hypothetical protein [Saccharothrix sp. 6-C]QQQ78169.1 hypothetical protein IOD16_06775 [Saccharothrix sp. 6-C]
MKRSKRRGSRSDGNLVGVVGWIFADTLLVLVVVFLATQTGGAVSLPAPTTSTTTPTTTTSTAPPAVDSGYVCFLVTADVVLRDKSPSPQRDAALKSVEDQMWARLAQPDLAGRRAGVVLTFGTADHADPGEVSAAAFNAEVLPRLGRFSHREDGSVVASRAFWGGNPKEGEPDGAITVNVYPLIEGAHGPLTEPPPVNC